MAQGGYIVARDRENVRFQTSCPVPECGQEFSFTGEDTKPFEIALSLFERRYFYRSELSSSS